MLITGNLLEVTQANLPSTRIRVVGQPAHYEGRGLALTGSNLNVDRGKNEMRIDGPGRMEAMVDHDAEGHLLAIAMPVRVDWKHGMRFDGLTATFEQAVVASGPAQTLWTEVMEVKLQHPIRFSDVKMAQQPQIEQIFCRGGVFAENHALDPQPANALARTPRSGRLGRQPPHRRHAGSRAGLSHQRASRRRPGGHASRRRRTLRPQNPAGKPANRAMPANSNPDELTCVRVRFQGVLDGNVLRHKAQFHDQVRTAYAPVDSWNGHLDSDDPRDLGPRGVVLSSNTLAVDDMAPPNSNTRAIELNAAGNAVMEGGIFTARADRMSYAEIKDLLVLVGDGRTDAELFRQPRPACGTSRAAAQKIWYQPKSNRVLVDGAHSLEFNQAPNDNGSELKQGARMPGLGR